MIADIYNNPFAADGATTPPARSALAWLDCDREDLAEKGLDDVLALARRRLFENPDLATVYGRAVSERDLDTAAAALGEPVGRALAELLDYRFHSMDLSDMEELDGVLANYRESLIGPVVPSGAAQTVVAALLEEMLKHDRTSAISVAPPSIEEPELPSMSDLLSDLA